MSHLINTRRSKMLELNNFRRNFIIDVDDVISYDHPDAEDYDRYGVSLAITPIVNFTNEKGHEMTVSMTTLGYFISEDPTCTNDFEYYGYDIEPEMGFDNTADAKLTRAELEDLFCFSELDNKLWGSENGKTGEEEMWDAVKVELTKLKYSLCANLIKFGEEPMSHDIYVLAKVLRRF